MPFARLLVEWVQGIFAELTSVNDLRSLVLTHHDLLAILLGDEQRNCRQVAFNHVTQAHMRDLVYVRKAQLHLSASLVLTAAEKAYFLDENANAGERTIMADSDMSEATESWLISRE